MTADVDAFTGMKPGPFTNRPSRSSSSRAPQPTATRRPAPIDRRSTRPAACAGRKAASARCGPSERSTSARSTRTTPTGSEPTTAGAKRAARGSGVGGGPKGTRTAYFYGQRLLPVRSVVGRRSSPRPTLCPLAPPPTEPPCDNPFGLFCPPPSGEPTPTPSPGRQDAEAVAIGRAGSAAGGPPYSLMIVAPSPPSPRSPGRVDVDERMGAGALTRTASRRAPVPRPWMTTHLVEAGQRGVVQVAIQGLERLVDPGAAEVERRGDRSGPARAASAPIPPPRSRRLDERVIRALRADRAVLVDRLATGSATGSRSSVADADPHPARLEGRPARRPSRAR